jgi:hypothetical protein
MSKPVNNGKNWTQTEESTLKKLAKQNVDTDDIAKKLGRTVDSVYKKASREDISLKPKDK